MSYVIHVTAVLNALADDADSGKKEYACCLLNYLHGFAAIVYSRAGRQMVETNTDTLLRTRAAAMSTRFPVVVRLVVPPVMLF